VHIGVVVRVVLRHGVNHLLGLLAARGAVEEDQPLPRVGVLVCMCVCVCVCACGGGMSRGRLEDYHALSRYNTL
jgi:hypothetical protein